MTLLEPITFTRIALMTVLLVPVTLSAQNQPPIEKGSFRKPDLVELVVKDPRLKLDIRYATASNFAGMQVYEQPRAFLQRPAAEALTRAHTKMQRYGYGFIIFDGYRPWSVTKKFWDVTPPGKKEFVANPRKGSRHNRGAAVDLTLYDLRTGQPVRMPSEYDEFDKTAAIDYAGGAEEPRRMRDLLRQVMESEGFTPHPAEWWHYDFKDWRLYPILNVPFSELKTEGAAPARESVSPVGAAPVFSR